MDERRTESVFLERCDAADGSAARRADTVLDDGRVRSALEEEGTDAAEHGGGEAIGFVARDAVLDSGIAERFRHHGSEGRAAAGDGRRGADQILRKVFDGCNRGEKRL